MGKGTVVHREVQHIGSDLGVGVRHARAVDHFRNGPTDFKSSDGQVLGPVGHSMMGRHNVLFGKGVLELAGRPF